MNIRDITEKQQEISEQARDEIFDIFAKLKLDNELGRRLILIMLVSNYTLKADQEGLSRHDIQMLMADEIKQVMDVGWK